MFGMSKKGQVEKLSGFALTLGVFAIILAVVFVILSNLGSNSAITAGSYAANATTAMQAALYGLVGWMPIVVVAFIGGLILFLVVRQFGNK